MKRAIKALLLSPAAKNFVDKVEAAVPLIRKSTVVASPARTVTLAAPFSNPASREI